MTSSKRVGLFLQSVKEREILRAAIQQCGLSAVVLEWADYKAALGSHPDTIEAARAAGIELRCIVTDEVLTAAKAGARGAEKQRGVQAFKGWQAPPMVLVRDAAAVGKDKNSEHGVECEPDGWYEWVLERPLRMAEVTAQMRQMVHAISVFEQRHVAMREELKRARRIFESVGNGLTLCDARQKEMPLVYVNRAFERMTGYSSAECLGRNCRFLQGDDNDQPGLEKLREAMREERDVRVLLKNYRKDGTGFWNELYMTPIFDGGGRLTHYAGIQNDVTMQVESQMELNHMATHDAMTGLANRGMLFEQMKRALERARRNGTQVAVLFFDLDDFKEVNDVYGHAAGDELLKVVARRLRTAMRASETVARLGGDEFVVVLEETKGKWDPAEAMRRFGARVREPISLSDQKFYPSVSGGMALFPQDGDTPEALLKIADFNMYIAKHEAKSGLADGPGAMSVARAHAVGIAKRKRRSVEISR